LLRERDGGRRSADAEARARAGNGHSTPWTLDPAGLARVQRSAGNAAACLMIERSVAAAPDARLAPPLPLAEVARAAAEDAPTRNEARSTQRAPQPGPLAQRAATLASRAATLAGRVGAVRPARLAGALGGTAKHASTTVGRVARSVAGPGVAQPPLTASAQEIVAAPTPVEAGPQIALAASAEPPPAPAGAPAAPRRTGFRRRGAAPS
jgi:hypothetical protein